LRAKSQLNKAVRTPPMCKKPVGLGANLTFTGNVMVKIFERLMNGKRRLRNLDKRLYTRSDRLSKFLKGS